LVVFYTVSDIVALESVSPSPGVFPVT